MILSVEVKGIHDLVMLDTIIDLWKTKWNADEAELKGADDDDADDEQDDCDDSTCTDCKYPEAKCLVKDTAEFFAEHKGLFDALTSLTDAMRDSGVTGSVCFNCPHAVRSDDRG